MFGMSLSFYGLQAVLGLFIPLFSGGFRLSLFVLFAVLSVPCGIAAFVLYYWNKDTVFNSVLYALPVGFLAAEIIGISIYLSKYHTFLFQLIMDSVGLVLFGILFFKRAKSKIIYMISFVISALIFYFVLYHKAVSI
ncbi:hypothetical protein KTH81_07600 [Lachnospiraceae bacterium ASD3451]|nr:hypothetical protein [Diplocloster agilis]